MIRLKNVTKQFMTERQKILAVSDVSLHIPKGGLVYLSGKNGAGKTTLILLMSGLLSPTSGRIFIDGKDISILPERFLTDMRRNKMGIIFQERFLISNASVMENLILPVLPCNLPIKRIEKKGEMILDEFGLLDKKKNQCRNLSGGEKQRLMIARALINDPDIIFADEPFTHLDQDILSLFSRKVLQWVADGKTVVLTSHQKQVIPSSLSCLHFSLESGRFMESTS